MKNNNLSKINSNSISKYVMSLLGSHVTESGHEWCRGPIPQIPRAAGYDSKNLDMIRLRPAAHG
jgi:hypothetical protein